MPTQRVKLILLWQCISVCANFFVFHSLGGCCNWSSVVNFFQVHCIWQDIFFFGIFIYLDFWPSLSWRSNFFNNGLRDMNNNHPFNIHVPKYQIKLLQEQKWKEKVLNGVGSWGAEVVGGWSDTNYMSVEDLCGCVLKYTAFLFTNYADPFMSTGAFNICCLRDCVSRHNGGTL